MCTAKPKTPPPAPPPPPPAPPPVPVVLQSAVNEGSNGGVNGAGNKGRKSLRIDRTNRMGVDPNQATGLAGLNLPSSN